MRLAVQNHSQVTHPLPEYGEVINSATMPSHTHALESKSSGLLSRGL